MLIAWNLDWIVFLEAKISAFRIHRLVWMLPWLSGNSAGTLREGRPALLCSVLGSNLKACKVLTLWPLENTRLFSPWTSEYVKCSCQWWAFIACVHLGPSGCWMVYPAQPVFCAGRSPRCMSPAYFHYAVFRELHVRGVCLASPYQPPARGIHSRDNDRPVLCF